MDREVVNYRYLTNVLSLHGFVRSFVEYQGLLTGGSPGVSLNEEELVGLFNLNYNAGP